MNYPTLTKYGLTAQREREAAQYGGLYPARIGRQDRDLYRAIGENGELGAELSGKLVHEAQSGGVLPAVGDWVMLDRMDDRSGNAVIHHTLGRTSVFVRKAAGTSKAPQVVAANIDTVFLCMSLNADFNLRRMERYLTIAWDSGAAPVIVLTKSDLCAELQSRINEISLIAQGAEVLVCSAKEESGMAAVGERIRPGETVAFLGSSGVGKSTLINRLMGQDVLATGDIRESDGRGRHTTTSRELLLLPTGGIVIDTPGMRELQLYTGDLSRSFEDIEELSAQCRYGDCAHQSEPGCAVRQAIESGALTEERLLNYQKLQRELSYEGLNARQLEEKKITLMFGGKGEMKQALRYMKNKNRR